MIPYLILGIIFFCCAFIIVWDGELNFFETAIRGAKLIFYFLVTIAVIGFIGWGSVILLTLGLRS